VTNDILILKNEDAIKKCVINLIRTRIGERFFNNLLGTSVDNSLFELNGLEVSTILDEEIKTVLSNFEPRIVVKDVMVESMQDLYELNIKISYDIVGLPVPLQNIEFLLQPTRI
jgi:phage baseplate assembly protein W